MSSMGVSFSFMAVVMKQEKWKEMGLNLVGFIVGEML